MRQPLLLPSMLLGSALVLACGDQTAWTEPDNVGVSFAVTLNERVPFTVEFTNPCNGEVIAFEGVLHNLARETADGSGGFHLAFHYNLTVRGVGQSTGATYVGAEALTDRVNVKPPYPVTATFTIHTNVIGQGQVPNFLGHVTAHTTVNANGQVTSEIIKVRTECRGV